MTKAELSRLKSGAFLGLPSNFGSGTSRARALLVLILLITYIRLAPGKTEDLLDIFDGAWVSVLPPGPQLIFTTIPGNLREVSLPVLGTATLGISDGKDASNLKYRGRALIAIFLRRSDPQR